MRNLDFGKERIEDSGTKSALRTIACKVHVDALLPWLGLPGIALVLFKRNLMMETQFKRIIANGFSLVLLFVFFGVAGETRAQDKSFLWRVRSDKSNIYILGSVHFLKKEHYPLNGTIETAFDSTQKLVLEIDLKSEDSGTAQRVTLEKGINRERTLQQNVSPETYSLAEKRAQELS